MATMTQAALDESSAEPTPIARPSRRRRAVRRIVIVTAAVLGVMVVVLGAGAIALTASYSHTPSPAAHGTGHDAYWLGHAWVDGRKRQSDVDALAVRLRATGIHDLYVHSGPLRDDGSLDAALIPAAAWFVQAMHVALPGVRVQAWLGATTKPQHLRLDSPATRAAVLVSAGQVLDLGFDGIHFDFEPMANGDAGLLEMLSQAHTLTQARQTKLSVSAVHGEPMAGLAACLRFLYGGLSLWSGAYLHEVALRVDQVAVMAYDTALPTRATYGGYVRRATEIALAAVPPRVPLIIGVPAYDEGNLIHHPGAESVEAALRGVRLALGDNPPARDVGVALYVDFTINAEDWASYHDDWDSPRAG